MKLQTFRYLAPQAFKSLKLNGWMTFAAIFTIAISLFLCVAFWLLIQNIDANATQIESEVQIIAYIKDGVTDEDLAQAKTAIQAMPGFAGLSFISKKDGLAQLAPEFNLSSEDELLETLGGVNPLPNSYSIQAQTPEDVASLAQKVEQLEIIESVRYGEGTVDKLFTFTDTMRLAGVVVMVLLAVAAIMLVAMTTRLTVYARRKEIMVMKWVGATNWFIRWPFLLEGVVLGLIGSGLALILALTGYTQVIDYLSQTIPFVFFLELGHLWAPLTLYTLGAGVLMGAVGSIISMAKFLNV